MSEFNIQNVLKSCSGKMIKIILYSNKMIYKNSTNIGVYNIKNDSEYTKIFSIFKNNYYFKIVKYKKIIYT